MANIITAREKHREFRPGAKEMCPKCSQPGVFFGMYEGRRLYFCKEHFREYCALAQNNPRMLEEKT